MESEKAWLNFLKTGSVNSYLVYSSIKKREIFQELNNATKDNNRRDNNKRN